MIPIDAFYLISLDFKPLLLLVASQDLLNRILESLADEQGINLVPPILFIK